MKPSRPITWSVLAWEECLYFSLKGYSFPNALAEAVCFLRRHKKANWVQYRAMSRRLRSMGFTAKQTRQLLADAWELKGRRWGAAS